MHLCVWIFRCKAFTRCCLVVVFFVFVFFGRVFWWKKKLLTTYWVWIKQKINIMLLKKGPPFFFFLRSMAIFPNLSSLSASLRTKLRNEWRMIKKKYIICPYFVVGGVSNTFRKSWQNFLRFPTFLSQIQREEIWPKHFAFPCYVFVTSSGFYPGFDPKNPDIHLTPYMINASVPVSDHCILCSMLNVKKKNKWQRF